ncbi:peptidase M61 [Flavobacterium sp. GT3R68]|uniref:M61 family metallopeptidase n=1 Tax=Flavobacterium sp. GT3R68 TaxID=2594437 RepID=UPI000F86D8D8|nr:peptidase M61 [Flavobacterium sp. GT3R68]RTY93364.1 peptidase M61 [Flavobacterium sp. GSN2]TRW92462.1 peptidase M61 [Flavobacterium sp. GT3R68]
MKKIIFAFAFTAILWSCKTASSATSASTPEEMKVAIDLNVVKDDKVMVTLATPKFATDQVTYHIPKMVPGTYSVDDYGKFIEGFTAWDANGKALTFNKSDDNSWVINNAKTLAKITYWVNDTYDTESTHDIFSPAGTNIEEGKNFMLNTHGFIGYFSEKNTIPYVLTISHPASLSGATSMVDTDATDSKDVFTTSRYAELVENPIMYSKPDFTSFTIDGMDILISVYSPNGSITAQSITPEMKTMMAAQKRFLGKFNATKKYTVLLYLSDMKKSDAHGFGALEHPTATTVVMPEMMPAEQLAEQLKDVVSHEFFHIVTPLSIHSKEIQYFDYNAPKMSEHLWMYEGVTEYFANLFQVNQGLISEDEFYMRMAGKINSADRMNDTMPFTKMSANVLTKPYKDEYLNVYEKGALIAMCLDIQIRESSNGERGILDLMQKLAVVYGPNRPFDDNELFAKITELTYPEVGQFLTTYVSGPTPIPYDKYFAKVGVMKTTKKVPGSVFLNGQTPYVTIKPDTKEIVILKEIELSAFMTTLGLKGDDIITAINGKNYNLDNVYEMIMESQKWKENDDVTVKIKRGGKEQTIKGKVKLSYVETAGYEANDSSKAKVKQAWLKG